MLSLLDLISQNQPHFQTHKALLVIGLQNDFLQTDGRLPVDSRNGFVERIQALVPRFRQRSSNVIWIKTVYEADRTGGDAASGDGDAVVIGGLVDALDSGTDDDDEIPRELLNSAQSRSSRHKQRAWDLLKKVSARKRQAVPETSRQTEEEELFLRRTAKTQPACVPSTTGVEFSDRIKPSIATSDAVLQTTNYSAFLGTSLLLILRAKLVTELYICGCITNVSILATVIDAARHGIRINVVVDCLGYRKQRRHDEALKRMVDFLDANIVTSKEVMENSDAEGSTPSSSTRGKSSRDIEDTLEGRVRNLKLGDEGPASSTDSRKSVYSAATPNGRPRTQSDASFAESGMTTDTKLSEDAFAEKLTRGAKLPNGREATAAAPKNNLVKANVRMRPRPHNTKKKSSEGSKKGSAEEQKTSSSKGPDSKTEKEDGGSKASASIIRVRADEQATPGAEANAGQQAEITEARPQRGKEAGAGPTCSVPQERQDAETPTSPPGPTESSSPPASPPRAAAEKAPRATRIAKAESSDMLRQNASGREQTLQSFPSQPSLSPPRADSRDQKPPVARSQRDPVVPALPLTRHLTDNADPNKTSPPPPPPERSLFRSPVATERPPKSAAKPMAPEAPAPVSSAGPAATPAPPAKSAKVSGQKQKLQSLATFPVLGPGDRIGEGDSRIIYDFLPADVRHPSDRSKPLKDLIFRQLYNEVRWQRMLHQQGEVPRLVCCQGDFGAGGFMPVYRHPTDQALPLLRFTPQVRVIRKQAEKLVGHPLNHVLIQLYRSGHDFISEHSDKTLDIVKGSSIVNVSFGAQRTMRLRSKKSAKAGESSEADLRETQRVAMPHNSMFVLGLKTNKKWLHGIMADKRLDSEKSEAETAYSGMRISLTFRHIGTFLDGPSKLIWGQGATAKEQTEAQEVINGDEEGNEQMVRAFSRENHDPDFDWEEWYGEGFDVLHFRDPPKDKRILFTSNNAVETRMIKILLTEMKLDHTLIEAPALNKQYELDRQILFRDNDVNHTEVQFTGPILVYVDRYYPLDSSDRGRPCFSRSLDVIVHVSGILKMWWNRHVPTYLDDFVTHLELLEEKQQMEPGPFIAGRRFAAADCCAWPMLDEVVPNWEGWSEERFPALTEYYRMLWKKKKSVQWCRKELPSIRQREEGTELGGIEVDDGSEEEDEESGTEEED